MAFTGTLLAACSQKKSGSGDPEETEATSTPSVPYERLPPQAGSLPDITNLQIEVEGRLASLSWNQSASTSSYIVTWAFEKSSVKEIGRQTINAHAYQLGFVETAQIPDLSPGSYLFSVQGFAVSGMTFKASTIGMVAEDF